MTELMETLYTYAQSHAMAAFLAEDTEYERCAQCALAQETNLRATLNPDETARLKALLDERDLSLFIRERAAFSAGFRMALELTR
ncbi:MAG: hypothetical protein HDT35_03040 [Clostridiales bacterium]|nr:hypothetical protein [Clostridiales bacterium]